jgi:hypothetical protein
MDVGATFGFGPGFSFGHGSKMRISTFTI